MADVLRSKLQHIFLVFACVISVLGLKVGAGSTKVGGKGLLFGRLSRREIGQHLAARDEYIRQILVTMNVEKCITSRRVHRIANALHFRAALCRRREPFAIQVGTQRVGAQVAENGAVGIHVRNDVERRAIAQLDCQRVGVVEQAQQQAVDKPFRHGFAGMLPADDPYRPFAIADNKCIDVTSLNAGAEPSQPRAA